MLQLKRDYLDQKVLERLSSLQLHARLPMIGSVSGKHRSPIRGSSLEFAEYRKYVPGDDPRRLDWRAYARNDRYYIKEFEADTNLRMCLVVDTSGSMNFAHDGMRKLDYARRIAGTLAYIAAQQGDAVGLYCAGTGFHKEIPPKRSTAHLSAVLDELGAMEASGETGLANVLHETAERVRQRALIIILSDLFIEPEVVRNCLDHLRFRKHDVAVFHLLEQRELALEFDRPMRFVDMEGGEPILADPTVIGAQYQRALEIYLEDMNTVIQETEVDYHRIRIDENYDDVLARFLLGRTPKRHK
ncbi:DUF58 domain-containing protein [Candidatus Poribacteria bacterium]|nr:DUF58 domain-containing protein [Candidatus Poribacteria bacterium]MYA55143.1 DUF58 domain-containing protein [Candidatus Poribacteria bacterium]